LQAAELNQLMDLHQDGYIDLCFADGSHFSLVPNVRKTWHLPDEEILLPSTHSTPISVFGIMSLDCQLFSSMTEGTLNAEKIIEVFDDFAETIRKQTIVVIDNASMHHSKAFKKKMEEWKEKDLYIYYLPPYSPELNKIETLWQRIKYQWLELDAYANLKIFKERLMYVLNNIGNIFRIDFSKRFELY
jgi:transposase